MQQPLFRALIKTRLIPKVRQRCQNIAVPVLNSQIDQIIGTRSYVINNLPNEEPQVICWRPLAFELIFYTHVAAVHTTVFFDNDWMSLKKRADVEPKLRDTAFFPEYFIFNVKQLLRGHVSTLFYFRNTS